MKHKKVNLSVLLLVLGGLIIQAQQAVLSSGGEATGSGGTAAYSVGQMLYTTYSGGANGTVAQGVQQAFEISSTLDIETPSIELELVAYPNPTTNFLTLKVGKGDHASLSFQLYDSLGRLIESRKVAHSRETIQMAHLPSAMYFLKVRNSNNDVKTFKIIKN